MKAIVGLGNPGSKYAQTRHNIGFMALDELIKKLEPLEKTFWEKASFARRGLAGTGSSLAEIKQIKFGSSAPHRGGAPLGRSLLLVKPTTFMNNSGFAVSKVLNYYKINPQDLTVIHDDLDLPFGKIRVRFGGGAGGHHGVESIIEQLKTDKFLRVRLGIGESRKINDERRTTNEDRVSRYVLGNISSAERGKIKTMLKETVRTIKLILKHGIEKYMGKYNK